MPRMKEHLVKSCMPRDVHRLRPRVLHLVRKPPSASPRWKIMRHGTRSKIFTRHVDRIYGKWRGFRSRAFQCSMELKKKEKRKEKEKNGKTQQKIFISRIDTICTQEMANIQIMFLSPWNLILSYLFFFKEEQRDNIIRLLYNNTRRRKW